MGAKRISDPYTISADLLGVGQNKQSGLDATVKYDLGWAKLTSITAIRKEKWKTSTDVDATEVGFLHLGAPNPSSDDTKFFSQDFTLVSSKNGPLEWTALASYLHQKIDTQFNFAIPAFGVIQLTNANITTDSSGLGGQVMKLTMPMARLWQLSTSRRLGRRGLRRLSQIILLLKR
ncbi:MAG: hypothetical protein NTY41_12640 [Proteobacteria bacterium]|nr:hypothetical protein [Pseudomonadota bacterium]